MKQWVVKISGKTYFFQSRTIKGARNKVRKIAASVLKWHEVK